MAQRPEAGSGTRARLLVGGGLIALFVAAVAAHARDALYEWSEKRVAVVVPGQLVRGAWQCPGPLRRIIAREKIRTIVSLAAIREDDPRYDGQRRVVRETGVNWVAIPIVGSRPTVEQMARAADLLADRRLRPILFHCIAGHHRTSMAHAAYRMRHEGWDADRAWREVSSFPWARPDKDRDDHLLIERFAAWNRDHPAVK
jgi:protein tyrosine phosphatase (PTP) superfamily phosphohydrolase (DUF442 family)